MTNLEAALRYLKHFSFSVIPVGKDKKPLIKWEEYQKRKATEQEVNGWWTETPDANIGIVTGEVSGISVVDVDTKEAAENLLQYIPESLECPTVQTPRGGHHLYFKFSGHSSKNGVLKNIDVKSQGGYVIAPPSQNGNGKPYVWTIKPTECPPPKLPEQFISVLNNNLNIYTPHIGNIITISANKDLQCLQLLTSEGIRDNDFFHVANCMIKGGLEPDYCFRVLEIIQEKANEGASHRIEKEQVIAKIKSAMDRSERRKGTIANELRNWICLQMLSFSLTQCLQDLQVLTREEKSAVYTTLNRFCKDGIISKIPGKVGIYKIIDSKVEIFDVTKVKPLEKMLIKWPLGEELYFFTSPKSISIIAGETDSGKSAYLANFCSLNMDKFPGRIHLFSSEMTPERFADRVKKMNGRPFNDWSKIPFIEKSDDFDAAIYPDDINIIDYMQLDPGQLYEVGTKIRLILEKLKKGIAIIGLQMKEGSDIAYGGSWTKQAAEFYLTISKNKEEQGNFAQIQKAKNWVSRVNPHRLKKKFFIIDGINFYPNKTRPNWFREGDKNYEEEGDF